MSGFSTRIWPHSHTSSVTEQLSSSGCFAGQDTLVVALPRDPSQQQEEGVVDPYTPVLVSHRPDPVSFFDVDAVDSFVFQSERQGQKLKEGRQKQMS